VRRPRRRATRIALGTVAAAAAVLGLAQLLLPGIAAQRVRDELGRYGVVKSATVSAFPAIELLWGGAQSASVNAGNLNMGSSQAAELVWKARGVQRIDMIAESIQLGSIRMRDIRIEKRGTALYIQGSVAPADFSGAVPGGMEVQSLESVPGGVQARVGGNLFGVSTSADALLSVQEGRLVVQTQGVPFAGFMKLTIFSASRMAIQSFNVVRLSSAGSDARYLVKLWAKLY
jgi:hypothetical protein